MIDKKHSPRARQGLRALALLAAAGTALPISTLAQERPDSLVADMIATLASSDPVLGDVDR